MESKDSLFLLIKSLKKGEKINFRKYVTLLSGDKMPDYMAFFDIIDREDSFNRDGIIRKLKENQLYNEYNNLRNYLYKKLLSFLAHFRTSTSTEFQLDEEIQKAQVLFERGLYDDCRKILIEAQKTAIETEKFAHSIRIIKLEQLLVNKINPTDAKEKYDAFANQLYECIYKLKNSSEYANLVNKLHTFFIKNNSAKTEEETKLITEIIQSDLLKNESLAMKHKWVVWIVLFLLGFEYNLKSQCQ